MYIYVGKLNWFDYAKNECITFIFPSGFTLNSPACACWQWTVDASGDRQHNTLEEGSITSISKATSKYSIRCQFGYYTFEGTVSVDFQSLTLTMSNLQDDTSSILLSLQFYKTEQPLSVSVFTGKLNWFNYAVNEMLTLVLTGNVANREHVVLNYQWTEDANGIHKKNNIVYGVLETTWNSNLSASFSDGYYIYNLTRYKDSNDLVLNMTNPNGDRDPRGANNLKRVYFQDLRIPQSSPTCNRDNHVSVSPGIPIPTRESLPSRPTSRQGFEIAIFCALTIEADAVLALFHPDCMWDENGPPFGKAAGDSNAYSTGAIGHLNVVLVHMAGMGKVHAAQSAASFRASYPNIRLALLVGVCGATPSTPSGKKIDLGDIIISDGIIQCDFGRQLPDRFVRKDTLLDSLGRPNTEIRVLLAKLKGLHSYRRLSSQISENLKLIQSDPELRAEYPGYSQNRDLGPTIHFGLFASGDSVIKSGTMRDALVKANNVIAFEMEGAGIWDNYPCVMIKSVCDYADSDKNKDWQHYAAATAAACMGAFLSFWVLNNNT